VYRPEALGHINPGDGQDSATLLNHAVIQGSFFAKPLPATQGSEILAPGFFAARGRCVVHQEDAEEPFVPRAFDHPG
jgi:hypothetical protein